MDFMQWLDHIIVAGTICWIFSVVFGTVRRFFLARWYVSIQEKLLAKIDSPQALMELTASDSGRRFLEALTLERPEPVTPARRILQGLQIGVVLTCLGIAMLALHHIVASYMGDTTGLLLFGTGAMGLGVGFIIAAGLSLLLSRSLGVLRNEVRE